MGTVILASDVWAALAGQSGYNVKYYGAKADGVADDRGAIQRAIDAAYDAGGGIVVLPAGAYAIGDTLVLKRGTWLQGLGWDRCGLGVTFPAKGPVLRPLSDIDVVRIAAGANAAGIQCLSVHYPGANFYSSTPTASTKAGIRFTTATTLTDEVTEGVVLRNIEVMGMGQALFGPYTDGVSVDIAQYMYCRVEAFHAARCKGGVIMAGASDMTFSDVHVSDCFGMDISTILPKVGPIADRSVGSVPSLVPSDTATNLIQDLGNCQIDKFAAYACGGDGLVLIDCIGATVDKGAFNSNGRHGLNIVGSGNQTRVLNSRIALNAGDGIFITTSSNSVQGLVFAKSRIEGNAKHGIEGVPGVGQGIGAIDIETCDVVDNATSAANTYDAIAIQGSDIRIRGGALGGYGVAPQTRYAFNGNFSGANRWTVTDVDCSGAQVAPKFSSASLFLDVANCKGISGQGFAAYTPAIPAKGSSHKIMNTSGTPVTVHILGHATLKVSVAKEDRDGTGVSLGDVLAGSSLAVRVLHGESIYWGQESNGLYGVPSDWHWYGE